MKCNAHTRPQRAIYEQPIHHCDGEIGMFFESYLVSHDALGTLGSCNKCGLVYHMEVKEGVEK